MRFEMSEYGIMDMSLNDAMEMLNELFGEGNCKDWELKNALERRIKQIAQQNARSV